MDPKLLILISVRALREYNSENHEIADCMQHVPEDSNA